MSLLFPRFTYAPVVRCSPAARHDIAPLWSLFDDTFAELQRASRATRRQFNPRFDVKETKEGYSLEGELPGIDQKNVSIEFTDEHTLTIKGRTESYTESGKTPQALEAGKEQAAVEAAPTSETASTKSHQATVEDEEPANALAVNESSEVAAPVSESAPAAQEPAKPENHFRVSERSVGEFSRSFSFPSRVNQDAVKASLKNGILSIVVPKAAVPESRRINIE